MKFGLGKILQGASAVAIAISMAPAAHAQTAPAAAAASTDEEEIVVTGTSIRGVAPIGNQVVTMDQEAIRQSGASSTAQVLAKIPQISDFGGSPAVFGANNFQLSVNRPTLRNLGSGVASTAATLFLMDGHRLPGSGVLQTFVDPDVVPPSLIQRVEVVPDGGSSIYGSDAVAGVVNFITRNDFDGIQVDVRHGIGDSYTSDDDSLTMGKTWDGGSAFIAYSYSHSDPIFGGDRDYVRDINWQTAHPAGDNTTFDPASGLGTETRCFEPNVRIGPAPANRFHALSGGEPVACDRAREADLYAENERRSVLVGFSQELSENFEFTVKGWYTARDVDSNSGPLRAEVTVAAASPFSLNAGLNQLVDFSFAPVRPVTGTTNHLETWGFAPEIKWDIGHDWQFRASANYGFSRTNTDNPVLNGADLQAAVNAGQINPYNLLDPTRLDNVNNVLNRRTWRGFGEDEITQVRGVFDGPVFTLPGGEVHVAIGAERFTESFRTFSDGSSNFITSAGRNECAGILAAGGTPFTGCNAGLASTVPFTTKGDDRRVNAFFAELSLPIIGEGNRLPFIYSLDLSLSGRHDDYSDVGGVTTKRYGFNYQPNEWIKFNGHWGDSFQAPGLADTARSGNIYTTTSLIPAGILVAPEDAAAVALNGGLSSYNFFALQGTNPGLQPQNAEAWDLSFDITPPILNDRLTFGATYWSIDYALRIGSALTFIANPAVYTLFPTKLFHDPTGTPGGFSYADLQALFPDASGLATLAGNGKPLYAFYDFRNTNTGGDRRSGIDFRANWTDTTPIGTWFAGFNGTHFIHYAISPGEGSKWQPDQVGIDGGVADWRYTTTLGATIGEHWLGQLTWNHTDRTRLGPPPLGVGTTGPISAGVDGVLGTADDLNPAFDDQAHIDDFDTLDAFVQYEFRGTGMTQDLMLTLNVTNITDEDPIQLKRTNGQSAGFTGSTLGRVFQIGLSKHF